MIHTFTHFVLLMQAISFSCLVARAETLLAGPNQTANRAIQINGDTPWIIMEADFENPAIQEAIRDAERDW